MKNLKHEAELFKAGLLAGIDYAEKRKAVEFEPTDYFEILRGEKMVTETILVTPKVAAAWLERNRLKRRRKAASCG